MTAGLAESMEKLGTHTFDDAEASVRTIADLRAIADVAGTEYLDVIVEAVASPRPYGESDV
jgi:hypothetical protein